VSQIVHWEIPSTDLAKSRDFYAGLFGWTFREFSPEYMLFDSGEGSGGGISKVEAVPEPCIDVYVGVSDIGETLAKVADLGGRIAAPRTEIGGGMGYWAAFLDPCGCKLCIWSQDG
jgi:hypothetical protein